MKTGFAVAVMTTAVWVGARAAEPPPALAWDAMEKTYNAKPGQAEARVTFTVTNTSDKPVKIFDVGTSCHCTTARPPRDPWVLAPGASDPLEVVEDLQNRRGGLTKFIYIESNAGEQQLVLHVNIPLMPEQKREMNLDVAFADRQAVLHGDCATCHVTPTVGKTGAELFAKACMICHGAAPRASMVPDLAVAKERRDAAFWDKWIREGKEGTLMPAFAKDRGGPLDDGQIRSLVEYLAANLPAEPARK